MSSSPTRRTDRAARLAVVAELRQLLRSHGKGGTLLDTEEPPLRRPTASTVAALEESGQGWARPEAGTLGVIAGSQSCGKTTLALEQLAQLTREGRLAAIVEGAARLFPPALALLEARLDRVLFLHPSPRREVWAAEQVLRSGLFALVLLLPSAALRRSSLRRLQLAAERGRAAGLLVQPGPWASWPGLVALHLQVEASPGDDDWSPLAAPPRQQRVRQVRRGALAPTTRQRPQDAALA